MEYHQDKTFDKLNFTANPLAKGEYENCVFKNCELSNTDLTDVKFIECRFIACNLSLAKLMRTTLRDVNFKDCKMLGMHFDKCNEFGLSVSFDTCNLSRNGIHQYAGGISGFSAWYINSYAV